MPTVQIKTVPGLKFVSKEHRGPYADLAKEFAAVYAWAKERKLRVTGFFGLLYDDPEKVEEAQLRSDACVAFSGDLPPDSGTTPREFPVQEVAAVVYEGSARGARHAHEAIERWLKENRIERADSVHGVNHQTATREHYPYDPARMPVNGYKVEVHVPVTRLKVRPPDAEPRG
ncbi:MAG: GyrI-like domain-containing protein [Planctomycetota bacterium]